MYLELTMYGELSANLIQKDAGAHDLASIH